MLMVFAIISGIYFILFIIETQNKNTAQIRNDFLSEAYKRSQNPEVNAPPTEERMKNNVEGKVEENNPIESEQIPVKLKV